jgi:Na+/H+ antiporter NhaD/arsenite permease-like protein
MSDLQIYLTLITFTAVIVLIAFDLIDMAVAGLLGVCILLVLGILEDDDLVAAFRTASGPVALLFGGMVVASVLAKTGIFERVGNLYLRATRGSGKRFLLLLALMVAVTCSVLPNATTVILLAPVIIRVAKELKLDFVGPMILTAIVSNSAGMLTLVGDPATFLVGSSIGMTFGHYLQKVSLGGLLAVIMVIPLLPVLMPQIWHARCTLPTEKVKISLEHPWFVALALSVLGLMIVLFFIGERLPTPIVPPAVAIIGATLALLVIYAVRIEPLDNVIRDVDWKTLIFLSAIFCLVQAFSKTGLLQGMAITFYNWFGANFILVALGLLGGIGAMSCLLANIPIVAASLVMTKGYFVVAGAVPDAALTTGFTDWPAATLPVFVAMMFGGTLGGNATLIGASANIVSFGICQKHGQHVSFGRFVRYGLPITVAQLVMSAIYVTGLAWLSL